MPILKGIKQEHTMERLTKESFKEKIFDFDAKNDWEYHGSVPCIIDFHADWCGPCKMLLPVLENLSLEYDGRVIMYKVNTDEQGELASLFGITSIPSLLFVPMEGKPQMATGALPREVLINVIKDVLKA